MKCAHVVYILSLIFINKTLHAVDQEKYTPKNLCVRLTTNNTAVVQWFEPSIVQEQIMGFKIFHTKDPELPLEDWNFTLIGSYPLATIKDISLGEEYTFKIQLETVGLDEPGPLSEDYSVKMVNRTRSCYDQPKTATIRSVNILRATATSYTSIEVWWNVPYDPNLHIGYRLFYGINDSHIWHNVTIGLVQSFELTSLEQLGVYKISLAILTKSGLDHFIQEVTVQVLPEEVPVDVMVFDITPNSMTLQWSQPSGFRPVHYKISYDALKEYFDSTGIRQRFHINKIELTHNARTTSYHIKELLPNTNYNISITAVPVDRSYRPAAKIVAKTEMAAPPPLVKPDFYGTVKGGNVHVLLPRASEEYGQVSHYYIIVVSQEGDRPSRTYSIDDMAGRDFKDENASVAYIAAKFAQKIPYAFILGNGEEYEGYTNRKLKSGRKYKMFVRAVVDASFEDLFTDSPYSDEFYLGMSNVKNKTSQYAE